MSAGRGWPLARRISAAQPGQHLLHLERLRHVVVRAVVDALDPLVPAAAGGQHQHRDGQRGVAPAAEERQAVDAGQPEVQDDGVVGFGADEEVGLLAVGGAVHGVSGLANGVCQLARQGRFVFDDQDPHSRRLA